MKIEQGKLFEERLTEEIADTLNVCTNWLIHRNIDIEQIMNTILSKNLARVK